MAVGIRPNAALAKEAGLETNRGVLVGDDMRTSDPDVFARRRMRRASRALSTASWPHSTRWRRSLPRSSPATKRQPIPAPSRSTKLKVTGVDLFSAGDFGEAEDRQDIVLRDAARGVYKRLVLKENRIVGAVLYGDTADGSWFFDLLRKETDSRNCAIP